MTLLSHSAGNTYCTKTKQLPLDSAFEDLSNSVNSVSLHGFATMHMFSAFGYLQFCFVYNLEYVNLLKIYSRFLPCNLFRLKAINLAVQPLESLSKYLQTGNILVFFLVSIMRNHDTKNHPYYGLVASS